MHSKRMKDALCRPANLSPRAQMESEDLHTVDDEYCHSHSAYLQRATNASEKQAWDRAFLQEFANFAADTEGIARDRGTSRGWNVG